MQPDTIKRTMAEVIADREKRKSPGRTFVEAYMTDGLKASVDFDETITDSLTSSRRKPRYPTRNMFKVVDLSKSPRSYYWHETLAADTDPVIPGADLRPELSSRTHKSPIPELLPTQGWVQVPEELWDDPEGFESFINYRLIVRLSTQENVTILNGDEGLLAMPGIVRLPPKKGLTSNILAACDEVEQMGCTADGLVINPVDYYKYLESGSLMDTLERNGVFIVRTRLVDPGTALVGDFGHGAQLFDAGRSVMRFAEPPPGKFAQPGIAIMAEIYVRVVVNLPFTFYLVDV
jgi:hypothetical protein